MTANASSTILFHSNASRLATTSKGITVGSGVTIEKNGQATFAGVVTATKFIGDGSELIGIDASALKFGGAVKAQANGFGVVVTGVTTSSGGFSGDLSGNATTATDLSINGTNQLLYQAGNNNSAILPTGNAGQILQSNGSGSAPQWVTSAPAGAIEGITIRDENNIVGSANSISTINFIGGNVVADAAVAAGIATVTINALSVKDEGSSVGTAGSITTLNFVGAGIVVDAAAGAGIATVTSAGGATMGDIVALAIALG